MNNDNCLLLGCGILRKEVQWLIEKNGWPLDTVFLDSALHVDFGKLERGLTAVLAKNHARDTIVFYGCCHPLMDNILADANTFRTVGQNCVDMLLGNELFTAELTNGAFFLLEDWARRWHYVMIKTFGDNPAVIREIFQGDRGYILALRTPCSNDFTAEAETASKTVGLPLRWMDVSLDHLESVLQTAVTRKLRETK